MRDHKSKVESIKYKVIKVEKRKVVYKIKTYKRDERE